VNEPASVHNIALGYDTIFFEQPAKIFWFAAWWKGTNENFCTLEVKI
jgi:hypothetical protein